MMIKQAQEGCRKGTTMAGEGGQQIHQTWSRQCVFSKRGRDDWKALNPGIRNQELMSQAKEG
jgi:hypothetical protein